MKQKIIDHEKGLQERLKKQYIASKTISISTVHLIILLIFGCQLYGKTVNIITFSSGKYIISIQVRTKGVNYRKFDPMENYKNDFHSIADRPMMTVVPVKTSHINDKIQFYIMNTGQTNSNIFTLKLFYFES